MFGISEVANLGPFESRGAAPLIGGGGEAVWTWMLSPHRDGAFSAGVVEPSAAFSCDGTGRLVISLGFFYGACQAMARSGDIGVRATVLLVFLSHR